MFECVPLNSLMFCSGYSGFSLFGGAAIFSELWVVARVRAISCLHMVTLCES
jgi:hypothetical protein